MLHKLTEIFAEYCREHLANERIKFMKKKLYRQSKETANGGEDATALRSSLRGSR